MVIFYNLRVKKEIAVHQVILEKRDKKVKGVILDYEVFQEIQL